MHRLLPLTLLLVLGCGDDVVENDDDIPGAPDIHVTPASLEFNPLLAGEAATFPLTIANTGDVSLTIEDLSLDGDSGFVFDDTIDRLVEPDNSVQLDVTCAPTTDGELAADLHVISDDPDTPDVAVALTCTGMVPVIEVDPVDIDFGDVPIGCAVEAEVTISSVGSVAFVLEEVVFTPTSDEMAVSWYFQGGAELGPGTSETIYVTYQPRDVAQDTGDLTLSTDVPASPTVTVTAVGDGVLGEEVTDEFVDTGNRTDILWVINDTASMADDVGAALGYLSSVLDLLEVLDADWQMGVITSSDPVLRGVSPVMTQATPDVHAVFMDAIAAPLTGTDETGLATSVEALTPPLAAQGGPNQGLVREHSGLRIVYLDDEDGQSPDPVADYVATLQSLKVDSDQVRLAAVVDPAQAVRWTEAVTATTGIQEDISGANWFDLVSNLSSFCTSQQDTFKLSHTPVVESLAVWTGPASLPWGWYYDAVLNAVVLDPDYLPGAGGIVTVTYNVLEGC